MGTTDPNMYSAKKSSDYKRAVSIGAIVCLAILAIFILFFDKPAPDQEPEPVAAAEKRKRETEEPAPVLDDTKMIEEEDVEVVDVRPKAQPAKPKPKPAKPKAEPVKPKPTPKAAPKSGNTPLVTGYYLQIGAFVYKNNFDKQRDEIKKLGYPVNMRRSLKEVTSYNVVLGLYSSYDSAKTTADEVKRAKYSPTIVKLGGGQHKVIISPVLYESEAKEIVRRLSKDKISAKIDKQKVKADIYALLAGPYLSKAKVESIKKELKQKGFDSYQFFIGK